MTTSAALPAAGISVGDVELSTQVLQALLPLLLLLAGLAVWALIDLSRAPSVRYLPKIVWAVIILFVSSPFGVLAYFALGRNRDGANPAESDDPHRFGADRDGPDRDHAGWAER